MGLTLGEIAAESRENNIRLGWRTPDGGVCEGQTFGDYIALLHSEVSEALEAYRDHRLADATKVGSCAFGACDNHPHKPEGVGSEFADVLIRLVDMADVWKLPLTDSSLTLDQISDLHETLPPGCTLESFGDWMAWLSHRIDAMYVRRSLTPWMLRALVTTARHFGIDLEAEYRRVAAHNRTRPYQHGGRTLAGDKETKDA